MFVTFTEFLSNQRFFRIGPDCYIAQGSDARVLFGRLPAGTDIYTAVLQDRRIMLT